MKFLFHRSHRRGFTLLELLAVIAIMGILGAAAIGSYHTMRRGIEERGVLLNVSMFLKLAYQRSQIDMQPIALYFWNETLQEENESSGTSAVVVGRAAAVRKLGRISRVQLPLLVDEFGDLRTFRYISDDGKDADSTADQAKNDAGRYLYRINGDEHTFLRSRVSQVTVYVPGTPERMMTDEEWKTGDSAADHKSGRAVDSYAWYVLDGNVSWNAGDAYGCEIAELELPSGYIFGGSYSTSRTDPIKPIQTFTFNPLTGSDGSDVKMKVYAIRSDKSGNPTVKLVDETTAAGFEGSY